MAATLDMPPTAGRKCEKVLAILGSNRRGRSRLVPILQAVLEGQALLCEDSHGRR